MVRRSVPIALVFAAAGLLAGCSSPSPGAEPPALAPPGDIHLQPDSRTIAATIPRDATLDLLLRSHGLTAERVLAVADVMRPVFSPRRLRAGQPYRLVLGLDGALRRFVYEIDDDRYLEIVASPDEETGLSARVVNYEQDTALVAMTAEIDEAHPSIIAALDEAGEGVALAVALAEILSGEVDFNIELRVGDRLNLLFEQRLREGQPAGYGRIVAAELYNDDRIVRAFRFVAPDDEAGYYDADGRSLRRMFLKSPLPFAPAVTSGFSRRRLHPVHRIYRPHLGVDYRAATGTPVVAVASGVVVSAGFSGESGRMVRLRHSGGYETYYLHLSALGPGIRAGTRVTQGQPIGRVGMTGTANAPHLDYRVRKNGVFVNPLAVHRNMPPGKPIDARYLEAFHLVRTRAAWQLGERALGAAPVTARASSPQ